MAVYTGSRTDKGNGEEGQIHWYANMHNGEFTDDVFNILLDNSVDGSRQSHHIYSRNGDDLFHFQQMDKAQNLVQGRLEDFNPTQATLMYEGQVIDLTALPTTLDGGSVAGVVHVAVVEFQGQQWLRIQDLDGATLLFALEGARYLENTGDEIAPDRPSHDEGKGPEEQHFSFLTKAEADALPVVEYENPHNKVPLEFYQTFIGPLEKHLLNNRLDVFGDQGDFIEGRKNFDNPDGEFVGAGDQEIHAGGGDDVVNARTGNDTVFGGDGDDLIAGGLDRDLLHGDAGADRIWGGTEDDTLYGGDGDDTLDGGGESDSLVGGEGDDQLSGGDDDDVMKGGNGNDQASGGDGDDLLMGQDGADVLDGGGGDDVLKLGYGDDVGFGGDGHDEIRGFRGEEVLDGGAGDDTLLGNLGDDTLIGGAGDDRMQGGPGFDSFVFRELEFGDDRIVVDFRIGSDTLDFTGISEIDGLEDFTINQSGGNVLIEVNDAGSSIVIGDLDADELILRADEVFDF